jgi:hypothetical protein
VKGSLTMRTPWMALVLVAAPLIAFADDGPRIAKCEAGCAREFAKNRDSDRCNDEMDMNCKCGEKLDACRKACFMDNTKAEAGICDTGMVRMKDRKHCCYPGQSWSAKKDECIGLPTKCPEGLEPARLGGSNKGEAPEGDSCHDPKMIRFVHREQERDKERKNAPPPSGRAWNLRAHEVVNVLEHDGVAGQWAEKIIAIAHPSSGNRELVSITADEFGDWIRVELTADFHGGLSGTQYRMLVRLDISPTKGLVDSRIVSDNAPFAVAAPNKAQLASYFQMMASQITEGVK